MAFATPSPEKIWHGLSVSSGVADAAVHILQDTFDEPPDEPISADEVESELARLAAAIVGTKLEIQDLQQRTGEAEIFETHLMLLEDVTLLDHVRRTVSTKLLSVDYVYFKLMRRHMEALRGVDDPYLRERFIDIKDIMQRVMRHLRGEDRSELTFDHPVIIVAHDLTPSDTVQLDREKVVGFVIETGSTNSHAAIIARSLGIPAVMRVQGICGELHSGEHVVLDGAEGMLIQHPSAATLTRYRQIEAAADALDDMLHALCQQPAVTTDGRTIRVGANAEFVDDLDSIMESGAE
jgi:phosphotransferase system enzyme I (PtsI)